MTEQARPKPGIKKEVLQNVVIAKVQGAENMPKPEVEETHFNQGLLEKLGGNEGNLVGIFSTRFTFKGQEHVKQVIVVTSPKKAKN